MRLRTLLALVLLEYAVYRGLVWLYDATGLALLDSSLNVEVALALGALIILVATPLCGWRISRSLSDEPRPKIPRARLVR